jgi:hypothetical protein
MSILLIVLMVVAAGCGGGEASPPDTVLVTFETPEGSFTVRLDDPASIQRVEAALASDGRAGIPNGRILQGDGGVNVGHDWHLVEVELVDVTIEVCDGTVAHVDAHLGDYLAIGRYCPWSAEVVEVRSG